ncbi:MAG: CBS domain-containing protein [Desulfurococcales archaeon]|nr:CBS domain-containing protein [Desulfurococcales archaeon]
MVVLTETQKAILNVLVELYEKKGRKGMVKSKEVAKLLNKDEGTVRNVIMMLKNMGLVESRTGPAGGYAPTLKAYEVLGTPATYTHLGYGYMLVYKEDGVKRLPAIHMEIINIFRPEKPRALARVGGDISVIRVGDKVRVESGPAGKLIVEGIVSKVNPQGGEVSIDIDKLVIIPDELVGRVATRRLHTISESMSVRDAAKLLYEKRIRGAPVVDRDNKVVGFLTTTDISMIVGTGGDLDAPVSRYMRRNVFTINEHETIIEAMKLMDVYGVGRLLVIDNAGNPVGIVTRTDILRFILSLQTSH